MPTRSATSPHRTAPHHRTTTHRTTTNRTIAVVTGSRAEFGLLAPVMRAIADHRRLQLVTIATGTHLTTASHKDITAAGFPIHHRLPMQRKNHIGRAADLAAIARGIENFAPIFTAGNPPHIVLVLGDRIEAFAAAIAAHLAHRHLAHIHGGDRAEGVADESLRHAISKLAHIHFPATAQSRNRLIRMGEHPHTIFNLGSPAIDNLRDIPPIPTDPNTPTPDLLILQHPIGAPDDQEQKWMAATLAATARYSRLILAPNHDPGRTGILRALQHANHKPLAHLPRRQFLAHLKAARCIVGNSSAGLIEAAALKTPAVNLGPRQAGRQKPRSVIDCNYGKTPVARALKTALQLDLENLRHPYGNGHTGAKIAHTLATLDLAHIPLRKQNRY